MTAGLGIRASALPAWRELHDALMLLDRPTICASDAESFSDPQSEDVAYLAALCTGCPVFEFCEAFANANKETTGIYAGKHRQPKRGRPANETKEIPA